MRLHLPTRRSRAAEGEERAPKLSVLVPIYNAQDFLRECLDSLVGQTLRDMEIVCIDDGSTDSSAGIISEYAVRDGRIRVISKPNSGYGDSMNRGLDAARGTWIGICEPDDFCDARMFERLVRVAEHGRCDIAKANYRAHEQGAPDDPVVEVLAGFPYGRPFSPRDDLTILFTDPTIWAAVYRRSMLERNGVRFSATPGASFQDASFAHQCWICARRVVLLNDGFYHYRIDNAASSSKSGDKAYAVCDEYEHTFEFLRRRGDEELRSVGPVINVIRFGVYAWNYNRISPDHRVAFAKRWVEDIVRADDDGLLDPRRFTPGYRALLGELLDDPARFCELHADRIDQPPIK